MRPVTGLRHLGSSKAKLRNAKRMNTDRELADGSIETLHSDASSWEASETQLAKSPANETSPWFSPETSPLGWRDIVVIAMLVVLCDLTVYRGNGFAGLALLLVAAPILLWLASSRVRKDRSIWITGVMFVPLAARLLWSGNELQVSVGLLLLVAFSMALSGLRPYILDMVVFASQTIARACEHYSPSGTSKLNHSPSGAKIKAGPRFRSPISSHSESYASRRMRGKSTRTSKNARPRSANSSSMSINGIRT
jgi:hypothetical protein